MSDNGRVASGWQRFWFAPVDVSSLAVFRILFGLTVFAWSLSLAPDLSTWFGPRGLVPRSPTIGWTFTLLSGSPPMTLVLVLYVLLIVSSLCLTLGLGTRLAALAVWLLLLSFQRRDPVILNAGDNLLRINAFLLMLCPAGAALSLDRWLRHRDRFWEMPARVPWGLRLIQLQLSAVYLFSVWTKLRGTHWNDGTAVSYAMRISDFARFPLPDFLSHSLLISNLLTYGTLAVELSLALLVWNRRLRLWVLLAGVGLHLSIEFSMLIGFFSIAVLVSYVAFVPPERMTQVLDAGRRRLSRRARLSAVPVAALPRPATAVTAKTSRIMR